MTFGGNERAAQERLQAQIRDALNASVNVRTVRDVVSSERDKVMAEILTNVAKRAEPLGVQVVDVRLRRIEFAPEISESVYRRMEAERTRVANELRSIGAAEGEKIRAEADRQREVIVAQAYAKAQGVMGEGDAAAASIYAQAYGRTRSSTRTTRAWKPTALRSRSRATCWWSTQLQLLPVHEGSGRGLAPVTVPAK